MQLDSPESARAHGICYLQPVKLKLTATSCDLTVVTSAKEVMFSSALASLFVCLSVGRITQNLHNLFSQNSVERWQGSKEVIEHRPTYPWF